MTSILFLWNVKAVNAIGISQSITPNVATIGDIVEYKVNIELNDKAFLVYPDKREVLGAFSILSFRVQEKVIEQKKKISLTYKIAAYEVGELEIPSRNISWINQFGKEIQEKIPKLNIKIQSVLDTSEKQTKPLYPAFQLERNGNFFFIVLITFILLSLALLIFLRRSKTISNKKNKLKVKKSLYDQIAFREIKELENRGFILNGQIKTHYTHLSEIIKKYLSSLFQMRFLELTTTETIEHLKLKKVDNETLKRLRHFFYQCDHIKFSEDNQDSAHDAMLNKAVELINRTKHCQSGIGNAHDLS